MIVDPEDLNRLLEKANIDRHAAVQMRKANREEPMEQEEQPRPRGHGAPIERRADYGEL